MPEPLLTDTLLAEITARDEAAGDGLMQVDTFAALDRHTLLVEVLRLRAPGEASTWQSESTADE